MTIITTDTNITSALGITDPRTGIDYVADYIGNTGAFCDPIDNGGIEYDDDANVYRCTQATLDWWADHLEAMEAAELRLYHARQDYGYEDVDAYMSQAILGCDLEDMPAAIMAALDEFEAAQ